ncbi:acyl carrier protein [Streptomyces sp. NBRC 109706]|uniref:acyl carrier protein n=1 Tax=Streptomyces sp. NBRC 109706 TaxID=1550035 RepID=UPI000786520B|nr:acyl carrier protein [Streptomyces sp. NBRC 109706]
MSETVTTPSIDDVGDRISGFVTDRFPQAELTPSQDIFALGYINSLFAMELVMFVERAFAVTIPNEELNIDNFRTVESMSALVGRLRPSVAAG